jgi:rubrerythrin
MAVDDRALRDLTVESQDLQADALRGMRGVRADLSEVGRSRRDRPVDLDKVRAFDADRRRILRNGGFGIGALATRGLLATGFGATLASIVSTPANAQEEVDVQILQTAASLENLAVATYEAALGLPFIAEAPEAVKTFAMTTMEQHAEHGAGFNDLAESLGGERQDQPNPKYAKVVEDATPGLTDAAAVVDLAMSLEQVATQTYVADLSLLESSEVKANVASVMGVEAQHLATLRAVAALLEAGAVELIAIPTDLAALPAAAGSVSFPEPFEGTEMASPPEEGAVS